MLLVIIGTIFGRVEMYVDFALSTDCSISSDRSPPRAIMTRSALMAARWRGQAPRLGPSIPKAFLGYPHQHRFSRPRHLVHVLFLGAAVGLLRFPDFYTRMHAAGKGDTLSSLLICAGLGLYVFKAAFDGDPEHHVGWGEVFTFLKILAICAFVMMTSPDEHARAHARYYEEGVVPAGRAQKQTG
ncbi:MAG: monovalent cation/H(+) antiporter subunit G [Verrucomicrobiales bacterium]